MTMRAEHEVEEQHGLQPMQYVWIGVALTIITLVELAASLGPDLGYALIPILIVLSVVKFVVVVAYYMHLRFEHPLLWQAFAGSLALGVFVVIALITLFWTDITDVI
jgi:cytochrome c oxidase subunit 4